MTRTIDATPDPRSAPPLEPDGAAPPPAWTAAQELAFRLLFTVGGGLLLLVVYGSLFLAPVIGPLQALFARIGAALSGTAPERVELTGTGDTVAIWQYVFGWLAVALLITAVWTALDRGRPHYRPLGGLLFQCARLGLAIGMIFYGVAKLIPTQFGYMTEPVYQLRAAGDISQIDMLWGFMGASDGYSIVTGAVEVIGGVLLLFGRTWLLGALVSIVAMAQVVLLNVFYDVPVKFLAVALLLIAIGLTVPHRRNLWRTATGTGPGAPVQIWPAAGGAVPWLRRTARALAAVAVVGWTGLALVVGITGYGAQRTPLSAADGVWHATLFTVDGRPAAVTDTDPAPWINIAITDRDGPALGGAEHRATFATQDPTARVTTWNLTMAGDRWEIRYRTPDRPIVLTATQPDPDRLTLTGTVDGRVVDAEYRRRESGRSARDWLRIVHRAPDPERPSADFGSR